MHIARAIATAVATLSSGVIFPLYIYPNSDCSAWTPIINAISSHSSLPFILIINPASGPGGAQPDSSYQACIPRLRAANTQLLGYVHTSYGSRPAEDVNNDISLYAGWNIAFRPNGVFFDEASAAGDATHITQLQGYADNARSSFADVVILNPGTAPASIEYFNFADMIVTAENFYSSFSVSALPSGTATPGSKQAVILHDAPTSASPYQPLLSQLIGERDIGAVFISEAEYTSVSINWDAFVDAVQAAAS